MRDFRQLRVWEKAHELVLKIYRISRTFPDEEKFGISSQLRRSAASVPTNIAEGCGRNGDPDFARFLSIAAGSASETEYHILLSYDLGYIGKEDYLELSEKITEVKRMLFHFINSLTDKG